MKSDPLKKNEIIDEFEVCNTLRMISNEAECVTADSEIVRETNLPNVKEIREHEDVNMTQAAFALRIGTSFRNIQNWEQGLAAPTGPTCTLLRLIRDYPKEMLRLLEASERADSS